MLHLALGSSVQERCGLFGVNPEETTTMIQGWERLFLEDRLRELRFVSLEKRKLWVELIVAFYYLKGIIKKREMEIFCVQLVKGQEF